MAWLDGSSTSRTLAQLEAALRAIVNAGTAAALSITQNANTSASTSVGGALNINNTGNTGPGLVVYSNQASPAGRLFVVRSDSVTFSQAVVRFQGAGTSSVLDVSQTGTGQGVTIAAPGTTGTDHALSATLTGTGGTLASAGWFESSNTTASCVQITGRETGRGSLKISHEGDAAVADDANAAALSLDVKAVGTSGNTNAQGLFINATLGGTNGPMVDIRNNSNLLLKVRHMFATERAGAGLAFPVLQLGATAWIITSGTGSPEGVVTAPVSSEYHRTDGGTGTTIYRKETGSGNTGWVPTTSGGTAAGIPTVFNVKDAAYGATGNGTTDDTTAINLAIAAAVAAGGGIVFFPVGTYLCNGLVIGGDNVHLRGTGWGSVIKQTAGVADNTWLISAIGTGTAATSNRFNIEVSDLQLLGRSDTDTFTQYVHLLELSGVSDAVVERVLFKNWRGDAICIASNTFAGTQVERHNERITIRDCKFDGGAAHNNRNGITIIDGTDITIEKNYFTSCSFTGMPGAIDIEPNTNAYHRLRNIEIDDNSFDAVVGAAGVIGVFLNQAQSAYTLPPRNIRITRNTIKNCTNTNSPIYIHQVQTPTITTAFIDITVEENRIYDNTVEWLQAEGVRGLKVSRNRVLASPNGLALGYAFKCSDVEISDNYLLGVGTTSDTQFALYTTDRVDIHHNAIDAGASKIVSFENNVGSTSTSTSFYDNRIIGTGPATASLKNASHTLTASLNRWENNDTSLAPVAAHFAKLGRHPLGGVFSSTPGAVTTVNIPHTLGVVPTFMQVSPGNTNAAGKYATMAVTADATNVILTFSGALTGATVYAWNWAASV